MTCDFSHFDAFCLTCDGRIGPGDIIEVAKPHWDHKLNPLQMPTRPHLYKSKHENFMDRVYLPVRTGGELVAYAKEVIGILGHKQAYEPARSFHVL